MARSVEDQPGLYRVAGEFDGWAELGGHFRHELTSSGDRPAVGDYREKER
jgi:hypothetical protein